MVFLRKSKLCKGKTPEQHFLESKQHQADGSPNLVHMWKEWFADMFGFSWAWSYELAMKLVKKYQKLGRIVKTEKVQYECYDGVYKDTEFWWREDLLPPKSEEVVD